MKLLNKYLDRNSKDLSYRNHRKLPLSPSSLLMITLWNTSVTEKLQRFLFLLLLLSIFFFLYWREICIFCFLSSHTKYYGLMWDSYICVSHSNHHLRSIEDWDTWIIWTLTYSAYFLSCSMYSVCSFYFANNTFVACSLKSPERVCYLKRLYWIILSKRMNVRQDGNISNCLKKRR